MKKLIVLFAAMLMTGVAAQAEDHVMAATRGSAAPQSPSSLTLSLREAQDYAVKQNRSLKNAALAVQEAYAQRWQTIAAMLPQADGSYSYSNYLGYSATMSMMGNNIDINMPNVGALGVTATIGLNGQGIVGVLLNNLAIEMKKISLEQSESSLRASVTTSYMSVLVMQEIQQEHAEEQHQQHETQLRAGKELAARAAGSACRDRADTDPDNSRPAVGRGGA